MFSDPVSAFMENSTAFKIFLMSNLSLSSQTVDFLLDSEVSPFQVWQNGACFALLFSEYCFALKPLPVFPTSEHLLRDF